MSLQVMKIRQLTFRCTQKTRDLFGLKDRDLVETSAGDFWEWFAAVATFDRRKAVLFTHKVSLYSSWIAGIATRSTAPRPRPDSAETAEKRAPRSQRKLSQFKQPLSRFAWQVPGRM